MSSTQQRSDLETIEGVATQIIPPEKLSKYGVFGDLKRIAEGRYLVVVERDDAPDKGMLEEFLEWLRDPTRDEYHPAVVLQEVNFETGDEVLLRVKPAEDISSDVYLDPPIERPE